MNTDETSQLKHLNRSAGLAAGIAGVASIIMIGSTAAYASHTVVTVGGVSTPASVPVTGDNTSDITFETDYGVPMLCENSAISGTVNRGATVSVGNTVGTIGSLTLSDCTATSLGFDVIVTMEGQNIDVRADSDSGDPIPVDIQVDADVVDTTSGTACRFHATGSVRGVINPGSGSPDGTIVLQNGFDLLIDSAGGSSTGSSCGGEIYAGDLAQALGGDFDLVTSGPNAGPINH